MKNVFQVRVARKGVILLPKQLIAQNSIKEGDVVTLTDLGDGILVLNYGGASVEKIASTLAKQWKDSGESLESILATLREVRAERESGNRQDRTT